MIKGIGIDLVCLDIIRTMVEDTDNTSLYDTFTEAEIRLCRSSPNAVERFATRFAAKEATMKALGVGWNVDGVDWTEIEVINDDGDRPSVLLRGTAELKPKELGVRRTWVSLSHEGNVGIASVVLEG